eukprot:5736719-Amphidinium_carterae.2
MWVAPRRLRILLTAESVEGLFRGGLDVAGALATAALAALGGACVQLDFAFAPGSGGGPISVSPLDGLPALALVEPLSLCTGSAWVDEEDAIDSARV